ncbi:unnamed protein product [Caenorhabditis bovis]|uniref:DUF19 domain-containing protein n=1 Tax=Caenorhabditis bovis TaxID=2654633 RepID=A0A8S1F3W5_9PELO|nr:unnamed protein product [Caenorhabditis bovis]
MFMWLLVFPLLVLASSNGSVKSNVSIEFEGDPLGQQLLFCEDAYKNLRDDTESDKMLNETQVAELHNYCDSFLPKFKHCFERDVYEHIRDTCQVKNRIEIPLEFCVDIIRQFPMDIALCGGVHRMDLREVSEQKKCELVESRYECVVEYFKGRCGDQRVEADLKKGADGYIGQHFKCNQPTTS